jgi:hypothetical protein
MSAADGLARNQEDGSAILPTLTNLSLNLDLDPALDRLVIEQEQDQDQEQEHSGCRCRTQIRCSIPSVA